MATVQPWRSDHKAQAKAYPKPFKSRAAARGGEAKSWRWSLNHGRLMNVGREEFMEACGGRA